MQPCGTLQMRTRSKRNTRQAAPEVTSRPAVRVAEICMLAGIYGALLAPLIYTRSTIYPFTYPKVLFFQAAVDLTFPVWLALALRDRRYRPRPSGLLWSMLAWALAMTLATCFGDNPWRSLFSYPERMTGLWSQLHVLAWFVMATGTMKTTERRRRLVTVQLAAMFVAACAAIGQSADPTFIGAGEVGAGERLFGLLGNPIYLGGYETFTIPFAILLLRDVHGGRRGLLLLPVLAGLGALVLAGSRGPMLGLAAGLVVTVVVLGIAGRHRRLVVAATTGLLAVAATYGMFGALVANRPSMEPFWVQHENLRHFFCFSEPARLSLWRAAWDGFLRRPLLGWGPGGYESAFDVVYRGSFHILDCQDKAHNVPLGALCETGALGAAAYLAMWASFVVAVVRAARHSALTWPQSAALLGAGAGYFVHSLFAPDELATDLAVAVTFAVAAISTPAAEQSGRDAVPDPLSPVRIAQISLVSASALAVLLVGSLLPFISSCLAKSAMDGASRDSSAKIIAWLEEAQRLPTPYLDDQLAAVIGIAEDSVQPSKVRTWPQQKVISLALKLTEDYLRANPSHARYRTELANALATLARGTGRTDIERQAESLYLQSIAESPSRQTYRFAYAKFLTRSGRLGEAEEQLRRALVADPGMGEAIWSLGRFLWNDLKQADEGSRLMADSADVAAGKRFVPRSPLEWLQLAQALARQQRTDKLRAMVDSLQQSLPSDQLGTKACVEIAKAMEDVGLFRERDQVLQLGIKRSVLLAATVGDVLAGSARLRDGGRSAATR